MPEVLLRKFKSVEVVVAPNEETCAHCGHKFVWDELPESNTLTAKEHHTFWGAPCYETIVIGFVCPECGKENRF